MSERLSVPPDSETAVPAMEGPRTPEEDETYGPEPDDPRAAGAFDEPYDVPEYDPAHEQRECCGEGVSD